MTEQNPNPDLTDDTEGHGRYHPAAGAGDTENLDSLDDDTQGHSRVPGADDIADLDDDVEGHSRKPA